MSHTEISYTGVHIRPRRKSFFSNVVLVFVVVTLGRYN